jgi:hypothetical protein
MLPARDRIRFPWQKKSSNQETSPGTNITRPQFNKIAKRLLDSTERKHDTAARVATSLVAPGVAGIAAKLPGAALKRSLTDVTDDVTDADVQTMLKQVNGQRTRAGQKPVSIVTDFGSTPIGAQLKTMDKQVDKMPFLMRKLIRLRVPSYTSLERSPGFQLEADKIDPIIYRDPKSNIGAKGSVYAHELGHAAPGRKFMGLRGAAGLLSMGLADLGYTSGRNKKRTAVDNVVQGGLIGSGTLGVGATLHEEARASLIARKMLKALGKKPAGLSRAYATYLLGGLGIPVAAGALGYGAGHVVDKHSPVKQKKGR